MFRNAVNFVIHLTGVCRAFSEGAQVCQCPGAAWTVESEWPVCLADGPTLGCALDIATSSLVAGAGFKYPIQNGRTNKHCGDNVSKIPNSHVAHVSSFNSEAREGNDVTAQ